MMGLKDSNRDLFLCLLDSSSSSYDSSSSSSSSSCSSHVLAGLLQGLLAAFRIALSIGGRRNTPKAVK